MDGPIALPGQDHSVILSASPIKMAYGILTVSVATEFDDASLQPPRSDENDTRYNKSHRENIEDITTDDIEDKTATVIG